MAQVNNLWSILRSKYPETEYCLMAEVSNAAGFSRSNSADYIAVNLWPSRGLAINGIELKSFRSDWLNELRNPKKAENIFKHCDYFWLLTTDDTVAKIEEIPATWGWMYVTGNKIRIKKDAPKLTQVPLDKGFLVSMLRRAVDKTNFVHVDTIADKIAAAKEEGISSAQTENRYKLQRASELIKVVEEFEQSSGLKLGNNWNDYDPKKVGETVKFIINNGGAEKLKKDLEGLKKTATNVLNNINAALDNTPLQSFDKAAPVGINSNQ